MNEQKQKIFRSLDKADKFQPIDVFDLLTKGRRDQSGDFTDGAGCTSGQAVVLTGFAYSTKQPLINRRINLIEALEMTKVSDGRTAWDVLLDEYDALPEPKNIAWILDDIVEQLARGKP